MCQAAVACESASWPVWWWGAGNQVLATLVHSQGSWGACAASHGTAAAVPEIRITGYCAKGTNGDIVNICLG